MQIGVGVIAGCAQKLLPQDKNFIYDNALERAVGNFANKDLWFTSGLGRVIFCQSLRDSARRAFFAQCYRRSLKTRAC